MSFFTFILIVFLGLLVWFLFFYEHTTVLSHWSHGYDGLQFSLQEFYQSVQEALEKRQVPELSFSRVTHIIKLRTIVLDNRSRALQYSSLSGSDFRVSGNTVYVTVGPYPYLKHFSATAQVKTTGGTASAIRSFAKN